MQCRFMRNHGGVVEARQVIEGRAQANHAGNRRCAGFEAQGRGTKFGGVIIGGQYHLSTELPMMQARQRFIAAIQHAETLGAVQFMTGKYIEVAAQRLHVMPTMDHALGTVHHRQCAMGLGHAQQCRQRLPGAQYVG